MLIFIAALVTIWLWAPLSSNATRDASGLITTETYFGPFHYLTLHTELKEPNYTMERRLDTARLAVTALISAALWTVVIFKVRTGPITPPDPEN